MEGCGASAAAEAPGAACFAGLIRGPLGGGARARLTCPGDGGPPARGGGGGDLGPGNGGITTPGASAGASALVGYANGGGGGGWGRWLRLPLRCSSMSCRTLGGDDSTSLGFSALWMKMPSVSGPEGLVSSGGGLGVRGPPASSPTATAAATLRANCNRSPPAELADAPCAGEDLWSWLVAATRVRALASDPGPSGDGGSASYFGSVGNGDGSSGGGTASGGPPGTAPGPAAWCLDGCAHGGRSASSASRLVASCGGALALASACGGALRCCASE